MQTKYIELTLLPDIEVDLRYLWEQVYKKFHFTLSTLMHQNGGINSVGCSFPQYDLVNATLGCKMRVFAYSESDLKVLNLNNLFSDLSDHVHVSSIKQVPNHTEYATFGSVRRTTQSSAAKFARKAVKRAQARGEPINYDEALKKFANVTKNTQYPFIKQVSNSTGHKFSLAIKHTVRKNQILGQFNSFGLSNESTVPVF